MTRLTELDWEIAQERYEEAERSAAALRRTVDRLREDNRRYAMRNYNLHEKLKNRDARIEALEELLRAERASKHPEFGAQINQERTEAP